MAVAEANQTDGYRMVCALVCRKLGRAVNRKRVLRVMRERRLIQRRRRLDRRRRPGFFQVTRPERALASGHDVGLGRRARLVLPDGRDRLLHPRDRRLAPRTALPRQGIDRARRASGRGAPRPARDADARNRQRIRVHRPAFKLVLSGLGIAHRRGGYRDPESQAFIESWFGKLKERCVWLHEFETLDEAREVIGAHIDGYHHRPHSGLNYRTPAEVAQTWDDALGDLQTPAA